MNTPGQEMLKNKTAKMPVQENINQQVDGGATAKDGGVAGANMVAAVTTEISAKVVAIMEEKMSMISSKLDIIAANRKINSLPSLIAWMTRRQDPRGIISGSSVSKRGLKGAMHCIFSKPGGCPNSSTWKPRKARSGWTGATEVLVDLNPACPA